METVHGFTSWTVWTSPFSKGTWLSGIALTIGLSVVSAAHNKRANRNDAENYFVMVDILFRQPVNEKRASKFLRIIFAFSCIILLCGYEASITSKVIAPGVVRAIQDLAELVKASFKVFEPLMGRTLDGRSFHLKFLDLHNVLKNTNQETSVDPVSSDNLINTESRFAKFAYKDGDVHEFAALLSRNRTQALIHTRFRYSVPYEKGEAESIKAGLDLEVGLDRCNLVVQSPISPTLEGWTFNFKFHTEFRHNFEILKQSGCLRMWYGHYTGVHHDRPMWRARTKLQRRVQPTSLGKISLILQLTGFLVMGCALVLGLEICLKHFYLLPRGWVCLI